LRSSIQTFISGFKTTLSNILNNKQTFSLSVATITISIFILGLFLLLFSNLNGLLSKLDDQVQLIVYLNDNITSSEREVLKDIISKSAFVKSTTEVSKKLAWKEFQSNMSENLKPFLDLKFNPLPASYKIQFYEADSHLVHIRKLSEQLKAKKGVESVEYGQEWITKIEKFMFFSRLFLFAMGGLLCFGLILIISNTIRLSIYSRQDEIELMLLIGATPSFVKVPYLFEGILQGLAGSILAIFLIQGLNLYLKDEFQSAIESISMEFQFIAEPYLFGLVGLSLLIGLVASYLSTYQFLRIYK
tara:strand:+ start:5079 stop:5984 length:906 start_codon:yes stop_codon:yes gene_type:complete